MPPVSAFEADRWIDHDDAPSGRRHSFRGLLNPALEAPSKFLSFAKTSPGLLTIVSTILVIAILAAGGAMVYSSESRQSQLNTLVTRTEPLSDAAQELFNSLSVADSVATTSFLRKNTGDYSTIDSFNVAMQDASSAVIKATSGIDNIQSREMELVLQIQQSLPEYVQLISNAQTNDRMHNPVGASYLSQGSALMQTKLLPAAEELYANTSNQVRDQQRALVRPLWFPLSGIVAALIMLLVAQVWMAALTNRRLNIGYVLATTLMLFALLWASTSAALIWHAGTRNVEGTAAPLKELTQTRIMVQQMRTDEALGLIQRDYGDDRHKRFSDSMSTIGKTFDHLRGEVSSPSHIDNARAALVDWDKSHALMMTYLKGGKYNEALNAALELSDKSPQKAAAKREGTATAPRTAAAPSTANQPSTSNQPGQSSQSNQPSAQSSQPQPSAQQSAQPGAQGNSGQGNGSKQADFSSKSNEETNFEVVDGELQKLISETRQDLRNMLLDGRTAAGRVTNIVLILTIVSAVCVILGTRPRLQEFL